MKISVTEEDIAKGRPGNACACPVALAVKRQLSILGREVYVLVFDHIHIFGNSSSDDCELLIKTPAPPSVRDFTAAFDDDNERSLCQPFDFELSTEVRK